MEGGNESTELRRHPAPLEFVEGYGSVNILVALLLGLDCSVNLHYACFKQSDWPIKNYNQSECLN